MSYPSPRTPGGATPIYWEYVRMPTATPSPSPRHNWYEMPSTHGPSARPSHTRAYSYSSPTGMPPRTPLTSPRYNSRGEYATVYVSAKRSPSSHRPKGEHSTSPKRERRHSYTYVRASTPYGDSDEDEVFEAMGRTFVLPAEPRVRRKFDEFFVTYQKGRYTNHGEHAQSSPYYTDPAYVRGSPYESPRQQPAPPPQSGHSRRASFSTPRPSTSRSASMPTSRRSRGPRATLADAERHGIPEGYSLKYWDPTGEPYLLCGSVFDADSLGKWIFDWTTYSEGPGSPLANMAGELWLSLIKFSTNFEKAERTVGLVRSSTDRETLNDFVDAGVRMMKKLRALLKACESAMLKARKARSSKLGEESGVGFVDTMFGRDRELARTEKFMQSLRLFNVRFEANCEDILESPTR